MRMPELSPSAPTRRVKCPALRPCSRGLNWPPTNIGPLPCAVTSIPGATPLIVPPYHALARDVVRYVGEPIAFVVAESAESARDAAEAVVVDYEPLHPVISIADAVLPDAPSIWPEAKDNIAFQFNRGEIGPVEEAIRTLPMSWNASWSITASWPRRWKRAARSARSTP